MGLFKLFFNMNNAEGCREAMRLAYKKHYRSYEEGKIPQCTSAHNAGLSGALSTRYMAWGIPVDSGGIWAELSPFLAMDEDVAVEALAEYVVSQEKPGDANREWLKTLINDAFRSGAFSSSKMKRIFAMHGIMKGVPWCEFLEEDVSELLIKDAEYISDQIAKGAWSEDDMI